MRSDVAARLQGLRDDPPFDVDAGAERDGGGRRNLNIRRRRAQRRFGTEVLRHAVEDFQNLGKLDAGGVGIDLGLPAGVLHRRAARVVDGALLVLDAVPDRPHLEHAGGGDRGDHLVERGELVGLAARMS